MNVDQYIENNPQRFAMLTEACKQLAIENTAITKGALASALPLDFCLDDADPWRMIAAECVRAVADGTMTATPDTAAPVEPVADTRESIAARKLELERRAADLRGVLNTLTVERANARARFADCLREYLGGLPKISPEQNARDYIAASVQDRAERHVPNAPIFGPSTLDRQLGYAAGGNADDHARKQMRGAGHRRGAFPSSMRGATIPKG